MWKGERADRGHRYGVARVYSQQCSYVLSDAQAAQTAMRALLKRGGNYLDVGAGKAKPEQLMLLDDPAFLPDMALPPLELDVERLSLEPGAQGDSQRSSQSMMSIRGRRYVFSLRWELFEFGVEIKGTLEKFFHFLEKNANFSAIRSPPAPIPFHPSISAPPAEAPSIMASHSTTPSPAPKNPTSAMMVPSEKK